MKRVNGTTPGEREAARLLEQAAAQGKLKLSDWLMRNTDSHAIFDYKGLAASLKAETGADACWPNYSVKDTREMIERRGLGGNVIGAAKQRMCNGWEIAEALCEAHVPKEKWKHLQYEGRGRRWVAAIEALREAGK